MSEDPSVSELRERVRDLQPGDRRLLLAALAGERERPNRESVRDRWMSYCEEHPYDPLCAGTGRQEAPDAHLAGFSGGGGCAELWEHLSAYRNAGWSARR